MANLIDSTKYLDLTGLGIYDSLIKGVITAGDQANADALDALTTTVTNELTELDERVDNNTSGISSLNTRVESLETSTSDWNENDSTSPSYIKNRTHYEEASERTLFTGNKTPLWRENDDIFFDIPLYSLMQSGEEIEMKITPRGADGSTVLRGTVGYDGKAVLKTSYYPSGPSAFLYNERQFEFDVFNLVIYGISIPQDADVYFEIKVVKTVHVLDEKFIPATIARTEELRSGVFYNSNTRVLTDSNGNSINNIAHVGRIDFDGGFSNSINYLKNLNMLSGEISGVHNLNMSSGTISGVSQIDMSSGTLGGGYVNKINLNSGYITGLTGIYSLFGAPITISEVKKLTFYTGGSIENVYNINMDGNLTGVCNIGFAGGTTLVQKKARGTSGSIPVVTFEETTTGTRTMTLGKDNALSITDYYSGDYPDRPYGTPEVKISGTLNVSGKIYAGNTYNTISGNSGGMDIMTSGATNCYVGINGVKINTSGSISEVATLSFKSGGTLTPSVIGVQEIFGKNNVHISMSGSTTGDGIDFGNAPLKNINGIVMSTSSGIISGTLQGTIQSTTFSSGNTFTSGFINELKVALGIS